MISRVGRQLVTRSLATTTLPRLSHRPNFIRHPHLGVSWRFIPTRQMGVQVKYAVKSTPVEVTETPVLIVGQLQDLKALDYATISHKLGAQVPAEVWKKAVETLNPSPTDTIPLYLNMAAIAALPTKCSRHNTPSRAHAITKIVKSFTSGRNEHVVIMCDKSDVFASGCAVARAFPQFTRKTNANGSSKSGQDKGTVTVEFMCRNGEQVSAEEMSVLENAAFGIQLAAQIVDTPCNEMHTDEFLNLIRDVAKRTGAECTVIQGEELNERGFGGIYGVGKAAIHQPALGVLSYTPKGATETVAWVGKGIVYDTGGLSIKGKTAMPGMKRDCGGAAGILGAFYTAVKEGFTQNLHAVFCLAENAVGDRATRPDDIHTLYSGKTVEINNTDAEGRLVVADGVVYAQRDLKANVIIDMCTLTGAQGISTGRFHAAHLTNREEWERYTAMAGKVSGDLSFPIVFCPELHYSEFSSAVADMKNSVGDRSNAQSSCAGLFIFSHLGFDFPGVWVHIDMAYPVSAGDRATGYGVALLNTLFGKFSGSKLLQAAAPDTEINGTTPMDTETGGSQSKKMKKN
ncbi:probable aminopeptidase NPEPL1 [Tigriopus californicus]|nr:probable aminopeptidase NPEPL1 [Tigriopus californicus]